MVWLMLLAGLRRCEVLGLRMSDLRPGERRVFVAEGKAVISAWCRSAGRFSPRWLPTLIMNGVPRPVLITCLWY
jgi:integrase